MPNVPTVTLHHLHTEVGWHKTHMWKGGDRTPPQMQQGCTQVGATWQEGEGACKHTVCMPPPPLYTPIHVLHHTQRGRAPMEDAGEREEGGKKRVLVHCLHVLFLCLYLFKLCFIITYLVAQSNTKSRVQIICEKWAGPWEWCNSSKMSIDTWNH